MRPDDLHKLCRLVISSITIPTETSKGLMHQGAFMSTQGHLNIQSTHGHGWEMSWCERHSRHKHPILPRVLTLGNKPRTIWIMEESSAGQWEFLVTSVVKVVHFFSHPRLFYLWDFILSMINCAYWLWRFLYYLFLQSPSNIFPENSHEEFSIAMSLLF